MANRAQHMYGARYKTYKMQNGSYTAVLRKGPSVTVHIHHNSIVISITIHLSMSKMHERIMV